jgi:hypothetical protein
VKYCTTTFCNAFSSANLFPDKKFLNDPLMVLDQDNVVDAAELPTSTIATRPLSAEASLQQLNHPGLFI